MDFEKCGVLQLRNSWVNA